MVGRRREKIYEELTRQCNQISREDLLDKSGVTASEIAEVLGMLRSNVSSELNELVREKRVIKFVTRPVLYVPAELVHEQLGHALGEYTIFKSSLKNIIRNTNGQKENEDPFTHLIGVHGSLKNSVIQAKSAIVYPPHGLHTLIIGPTGSGKTLFAHIMHKYAKFVSRMDKASPFVEFNCADYYHNPQLLIGQLFGFVKGAFTGASHDQEGLVAKANGGILFLDEIHRLPPEGQEMLFYFIDTGRFSKLGEAGNNKHQSNVLIIGATTADPESTLLQTFLRRVPVMIKIPMFCERSVQEQIEIVKFLLSQEAHRTKRIFHVSADVIKSLIGSVSFGNIGQLKSNVQLTCAQGFLNSMDAQNLQLDVKMLPPEILTGLEHIRENPVLSQALNKLLPLHLVITGGKKDPTFIENDQYEPPFDLYKMITCKYSSLEQEGLSNGEIQKFVTDDIKVQLQEFYRNTVKNAFLTNIDGRVLDLLKDLEAICSTVLGNHLSSQFLNILSVHLSKVFEHPYRKLECSKELKQSLSTHTEEDFKAACAIAGLIEKRCAIKLPEVEILYIAFLLSSFEELAQQKKVGIVVAAHGAHTASSMVNVVKELLGEYPIAAVDMPLSLKFRDIYDHIVEAVKSVNQGAGVLMLVDMGSLYYFEEKVAKGANVRVKAVDMVSTPMILEAVKNANYMHMNLNDLVDSINKLRTVSGTSNRGRKGVQKKAILTICTTGSGIAQRIKNIVQMYIYNITDEEVEIIPISIEGLYEHAKKLKEKYEIMASIGAKNPKLDGVPYITLSQFVSGEGQDILESVFASKAMPIIHSPSNIIVKGVCEDSLQDMLMYLNPKKAVEAILEYTEVLQKLLGIHFKNATQIRFIMHLAFTLEREIARTPYKYEGMATSEKMKVLEKINPAAEVFKYKLNIQLSEGEALYVVDMLYDELDESVLIHFVTEH